MVGANPNRPVHRVRAKVRCRLRHEHEVCIRVSREVHPDLRCPERQDAGYVMGAGGSGCVLPPDLEALALRELREHYQESRRRGWVEITA